MFVVCECDHHYTAVLKLLNISLKSFKNFSALAVLLAKGIKIEFEIVSMVPNESSFIEYLEKLISVKLV